MLKKGGVVLGLLLCIMPAFAQDKTAELFRIDNPNLMNLGETKTYTGAPLVYIEGIKAPEVAHNDMEALQLKLFGTKNVREATKDTQELSDVTIPPTANQDQLLVFQNPFNQTIRSAFIPHVANFMTLIQILNQNQLMVSEHVVLVNTKENENWKRVILLPPQANAQITGYLQNDQNYPVSSAPHINALTFTSPVPLQQGVNHLVFKYKIENPFFHNLFRLQLVDQSSLWPIESFKTFVSFPTPLAINESKLLFGKNKLDIPDIYTQQSDAQANVTIAINRIIPPEASIELQMQFDVSSLPAKEKLHTGNFIWGMLAVLLTCYWLVFGWWERCRLHRPILPKIKYPKTLAVLAYQMGTQLNPLKWQQLIDFGRKNVWPLAKLLKEQDASKNAPKRTNFKVKLATFVSLMHESVLGTIILFTLTLVALSLAQEQINYYILMGMILFCVIGLCLLYTTTMKPLRKTYWQKKLNQLAQPTILTGLTMMQVRQIYPLFILVQKNEEWRKKLIKTNPKVAQETHLYKEEK